jgi:hypothetical protein
MLDHQFRQFSICSLVDDGRLKIHFWSDNYEECDKRLEKYWGMFPNAVIDIYDREDMIKADKNGEICKD